MTPVAVTTVLLHDLVSTFHAEGITAIDVASTIDHDGRTLLIVEPGADFIDDSWQLPTGSVLPGETLTDAVPKTLAAIGLDLDEITGYLGHHDRIDENITRVFCFAVTVPEPDRICQSAHTAHWWAGPDDLPDLPAPPGWAHIRPSTSSPQPGEPPLAGPLRAGARGLRAAEAGTDLLIRHATWLRRRDFRDLYVRLDSATLVEADMADIDWAAAITALDTGQLPCSASEAQMLRLAASLVDGIPLNLRDTLIGLDSHNIDIASQAVLHLNGP